MTQSPAGSTAAPGSILVYDRIAGNKRETWLLLGGFVVFIGGLLLAVGYIFDFGLPIMSLIGISLIFYALFSYYGSTQTVLSISGAHQVTKDEEWEFVRRVENLCIGAGLPMPKTWVLEDSAPNAFATGMDPKHAHVVVTRGLLDKLEPAELEGVLAHELSHIGNYDIRTMTVAAVLVGMVALISDLALRSFFWGGGSSRRSGRNSGDKKNGGAAMVLIIVVVIIAIVLAPLIAQVIHFAISRRREYLADASGALLCRNPEALARALEKISGDPEPLEAANKATAHLYISNPLKEHSSFLNNMFNTHPPIQERIALLRRM